MSIAHKIVAVIGCVALAGPLQAGVKNGHFENRGAGNIHWKTCGTWTPSEVFIPHVNGNSCSYLSIKTPSCGAGREAFQSDICIQPGGSGGFATLKFQSKANFATGTTVTFTLSSGASTTRKIPASAAWTTHAVSLPIPIIGPPPTAKVIYTVCGAGASAFLQVDNVSVCWTSTNQTTLGPPSPPICNCTLACPGANVEVVTGPPSICIGQDACICISPQDAPEAQAPRSPADRIVDTVSAWGSCEDCPQDVWPPHDPDGQIDVNDLLEVLSTRG